MYALSLPLSRSLAPPPNGATFPERKQQFLAQTQLPIQLIVWEAQARLNVARPSRPS